MPRRTRNALTALALAAALVGATGCSDDPDPSPLAEKATVEPATPSFYMEYAARTWNARRPGERAWEPVRARGAVWRGNPRDYERVCGATFLDEDGLVPDFLAAPDGSETGSAGDETWYEWLQRHPAKWAAFNAWLADPAVVATVGPAADHHDAGLGERQRALGDADGCPDAAEAGRPVRR